MRVLVLTDPSGHGPSNSVYALTRALVADPRTAEVRVASRAEPGNAEFFAAAGEPPTELRTILADDTFAFGTGFRDGAPLGTPLAWPDLVLLRIPHPIPTGWFEWVERCFRGSAIVNRPAGIATTTSKAWLLEVAELCPRMAVCATPDEVLAFAKTGAAVLKPLRGYGGQGIWLLRDGRAERGEERVPLDAWAAHPDSRHAYLAMEFLTRVGEGDKRIVVVDGEVLGSILRLPPPGSWLCNVARGGRVEPTTLTPGEERIVATLAPRMRALGVVMYGVDTLVGNDGARVLSEVNTMSIGGLLDLGPGPDDRSAAQRAAAAILDHAATERTDRQTFTSPTNLATRRS